MTSAAIRAWYLPMCVNSARPLQSPTAYSQSPSTPVTCSRSSVGTGRPGSRPTVSSPMSAVRGRRPTATRISSALISRSSARVAVTGPSAPSRRTAVSATPVVTAMPSASKARRTCSPANGSSRASSRGPPSTTVTSRAPSRRKACASSAPTAPPPITISRAFEAEGIAVTTGVALTAVRRDGADGPVTATLADDREINADEILVAVGRRPRTADIGLETVGLEPGRPVPTDDRLQVTGVDGDWLYAVGDCNGRALLTHMGKYQARIAADVILGRDAVDRSSVDMVPRVTFTDPQVCAVGLTEAQARERGLPVRVVAVDTGSVAGASTLGTGIAGT